MDLDLSKAIIEFYNDPNYNELNDYYQKENIFTIIKKERNETVHSAFLAWLLNPLSNHGLKDYALRKLLRLYATSEKAEESLKDWQSNFLIGDYVLDDVEVFTEKSTKTDTGEKTKEKEGRMDIYIEANIKPNKNNDSEQEERSLRICIENKIYSCEHDVQTETYHEYLKDNNDGSEPLLVEIFLAPTKNDGISAKSFVSLTYKQLLCHVIEPLLKLNCLNTSAALYIEDYIRVLGRPTLGNDEGEKGNPNKQYSLLALSNAEEKKLKSICDTRLYRMAYFAANRNVEGIENKLKEWKLQEVNFDDSKQLLSDFWKNNLNLFETVALSNGLVLDASQGESNRDTTKYLVKFDGKELNFKNKNGSRRKASKSECSLLIFKAWCLWYEQQNETKPSFEEICEAFPIKINSYYINRQWYKGKELFCKYVENNPDFKNGWDFFKADEDHKLELSDGSYLSLKMWRKEPFNKLLEWVNNDLKEFSEKLEITEV